MTIWSDRTLGRETWAEAEMGTRLSRANERKFKRFLAMQILSNLLVRNL
jgi:hypothetical protein